VVDVVVFLPILAKIHFYGGDAESAGELKFGAWLAVRGFGASVCIGANSSTALCCGSHVDNNGVYQRCYSFD
jgi:hypothetical protein